MRRYSLSQYYYSNPSFWREESHHKTHKKTSVCRSLASDADFALGFVDHSPFDDILLARDKWLRRVDSLLFSTPFGAIEREPFTVIDRIALEKRTTPFFTTIRRLRSTTAESWDLFAERVEESQFFRDREDYLDDLADRMAALEVGFENLMGFKSTKSQKSHKEWKSQNGGKTEVSYSYSTRRLADPLTVTVPGIREFSTFRAEKYAFSDGARASEPQTRVIPVEEGEGSDHRNSAASKKIQGVFARKRAAAAQVKGKRKELSPQDAALIIQARFREYLVHRSQTLRSLRDLAVAKAKLKELRTLFSNYGYRRHLCREPEERQRFSEKTIVVLLTVDSIQGSDSLVREARRSMIQELESMLDVVDPQPSNKAGAGRRRKFDLPESGPVNTEMEMEVSEVVGMLDEKNGGNLFPYVTL